jgi:hypothetical protein
MLVTMPAVSLYSGRRARKSWGWIPRTLSVYSIASANVVDQSAGRQRNELELARWGAPVQEALGQAGTAAVLSKMR